MAQATAPDGGVKRPWRPARGVALGTTFCPRHAAFPGRKGGTSLRLPRPGFAPLPLPNAPGRPAGDPVVPYHTIAFSQQKLRAAIRRAAGQDPAFTYGFVVHSRRYSARPTLGLITLQRREPGS